MFSSLEGDHGSMEEESGFVLEEAPLSLFSDVGHRQTVFISVPRATCSPTDVLYLIKVEDRPADSSEVLGHASGLILVLSCSCSCS